jgi:hypothetical protein
MLLAGSSAGTDIGPRSTSLEAAERLAFRATIYVSIDAGQDAVPLRYLEFTFEFHAVATRGTGRFVSS